MLTMPNADLAKHGNARHAPDDTSAASTVAQHAMNLMKSGPRPADRRRGFIAAEWTASGQRKVDDSF
jgi:hypothetical protein